jgi:hypothetical protein
MTQDIFPFHNNYITEKSGSIFYRRVNVSAQLEELTLQIRKAHANSERVSKFNASNAFVITWYLVPLENDSSKLQTFQLVLVTDGFMSFFIANYERTNRLSAVKSKSFTIQSIYKDKENSEFYFSGLQQTVARPVDGFSEWMVMDQPKDPGFLHVTFSILKLSTFQTLSYTNYKYVNSY